MSVTVNDVEIISDDGKFTENFNPKVLGDEYGDSKFFEDTPDVLTALKRGVDAKSMVGRKLENVIQKPSEDADETAKSQYRETLLKELGAPATKDDYVFETSEELGQDEEFINYFKEKFFSKKIPPSMAQEIVNDYNEYGTKQMEAQQALAEQQYNEAKTAYTKQFPGDSIKTENSTAYKAMLQFGNEDFTKLLKDSKIVDNVGDLDSWRKLGVTPDMLSLWNKIGKAMKSDDAIPDDGSHNSEDDGFASIYDHPTSAKLREERQK